MTLSGIYRKSPYLYFMAICFWIASQGILSGSLPSIQMFGIGLLFLYPLMKDSKGLHLLTAIVTMLWSVWILLAYISDVIKGNYIASESGRFIIGGAVLVTLNFLMSTKLFHNALDKAALKNRSTAATAA